MFTRIPFYKQVIVMSFHCEHCGYRNNELQSGEPVQVRFVSYLMSRFLPLFPGIWHGNRLESQGEVRSEPHGCQVWVCSDCSSWTGPGGSFQVPTRRYLDTHYSSNYSTYFRSHNCRGHSNESERRTSARSREETRIGLGKCCQSGWIPGETAEICRARITMDA